jgi:uncharacterized protein (DUF305 family)
MAPGGAEVRQGQQTWELAQDIIASENKEIALMKAWQAKRKK